MFTLVASAFPTRFVSFVSLVSLVSFVSIVSLCQLVHKKGRCSGGASSAVSLSRIQWQDDKSEGTPRIVDTPTCTIRARFFISLAGPYVSFKWLTPCA